MSEGGVADRCTYPLLPVKEAWPLSLLKGKLWPNNRGVALVPISPSEGGVAPWISVPVND